MCMKYAPYLHPKSAHWAFNMLLFWFFGADPVFFCNHNAKFAPNI